MATTAWVHPTTADTGDDWANAANATEDDTTVANPGADGHQNDWTAFKDAGETNSLLDLLPSDLTSIDGIEVRTRAYDVYGDGGAYTEITMSYNGGTNFTSSAETEARNPAASGAYGASATEYTSGGATSDFGRTWARTDFSDANFILNLTARSTDGYPEETRLEFIELRVHYTPASSGITVPVALAYYSKRRG